MNLIADNTKIPTTAYFCAVPETIPASIVKTINSVQVYSLRLSILKEQINDGEQ